MKVQEINIDHGPDVKKQKKMRPKFKKVGYWIKFIIIFILFVAVLILIALSPLFNIRNIEVYGNEYYEKETIIDISDILIGKNGFKSIGSSVASILTLRYGSVEERIKKNCPYMKSVVVKYVIPQSVRIDVVEREPVAAVLYLGTSLLIDDEGYIIDTVKNTEGSEFPLIKGIELEYYELGEKLATEKPEKIDTVIKVVREAKEADRDDNFKIMQMIDSIDVSNAREVYLFIDSRILVNFGDLQDLDYRMMALKQIMQKSLKAEDKGLLDFTVGEDPIFIPEK